MSAENDAEPAKDRRATLRQPFGSLRIRFYLLLAMLAGLALSPWLVSEEARQATDGFAQELQEIAALRYRLLQLRVELPHAHDSADSTLRLATLIHDQKDALDQLIAGDRAAGLRPCPTPEICGRLRTHNDRWHERLEPRLTTLLRSPTYTDAGLADLLDAEAAEIDLTARATARVVQARIDHTSRIGLGVGAGSLVLLILVAGGVWDVFGRIRKLRSLATTADPKKLAEVAASPDELGGLAHALASGIDAEQQRRHAEQRRARELQRQQHATHRSAEMLSAWISGEIGLERALAEVARASGYTGARLHREGLPEAQADGNIGPRQRFPLSWGNKPLGVLELTGDAPPEAGTDDELLDTLAEVFALACLADRLLTEKTEQGKLAIALSAVAARPTESDFGASLARLIAHDAAVMELWENTGRVGDVWAVQPTRLERIPMLCEHASPTELTIVPADSRDGCDILRGRCPGAQLMIPLFVSGTHVGNLNLARGDAEFGSLDVRTAEALAPVVASALARIQLEARLRFAEQWSTLGAFGRLLAHEIKNPLNSLSLELQLLERRVTKLSLADADREKVMASVLVVKNELGRLTALTNDYLALSPKHADAEQTPLDLRDIATEVARTHAATLADRSIVLTLDLGEEPALILGNPSRLKQLLHNLLGNAIEAMAASPERMASLKIRHRGTDVELSLRDTGPGVADPVAIFAPGFSTKPSGTGMGLAISQQIARQHGGRLTARAFETGGSEFTLSLSALDDAPPSSTANAEPEIFDKMKP